MSNTDLFRFTKSSKTLNAVLIIIPMILFLSGCMAV